MSRSYKLWLLSSLYLAQGLPFGFFTQALPVLLRDMGYSLTAIGATSFLFLPWALKFLWAPWVDARGTRRAWLLPLQLLAVVASLALALFDPGNGLWLLLVAMFVFNLIAATQDIATDGLAVNVLTPRERGLGNGIQVGAYRIGMILGGGLLLWVFAKAGWALTFSSMAALLALSLLPVLWLREPRTAAAPRTPTRELASTWITRLRQPGVPLFIALICFYKFGDSMGASLVGPYMRDAGMSKEMIALVKGTIGSGATLLGAAAGGWIAYAWGRRAALLSGGLLQTLSLMLYALSAAGYGGHPLIAFACFAEHVLGGIAVVALFTLMMDASDPQHASTDYTLLACALVVAQGLASLSGGIVADLAGYLPLFVLSVLLSGIGCLALVWALDRERGPQRLRASWRRRLAA
jgi:predicted MFS family arabinose efflux permease